MKITDKYIFFWKDFYSQWYLSDMKDPFTNIIFSCSEQYMMYKKAILFKDNVTAEQILLAKKPKEHKELGRKVANFEQSIWNNAKYEIVSNACMLKFTQNPKLLFELLNTGNKIFVKASPFDPVWGIAMSEDEPGIENEDNWKGENLLGYALTDTKNYIRNLLLSKDNLYEIK